MSLIDGVLNFMRLNPDDDEYDEDEDDFPYDEEDEEEEYPVKKSSGVFKKEHKEKEESSYEKSEASKEKPVKTAPKITPISKGTRKQVMGMEVCVIKPTSVEDAREITETLLNGRTVVLNVEGVNVDIAQRIIDFTSGSCFAISGNLQKISNYIFIITPANVDISGDFQNIVDSFDTSSFNY